MNNKNYNLIFFFCLSIIFLAIDAVAQSPEVLNKYIYQGTLSSGKPAINFNTLNQRTEALGDFAAISRDGRFCSYVIIGSVDYTMIQSTGDTWKHKLLGVKKGFFSGDNRFYIYQTGDSLCYLPLKGGMIRVLKDVVNYQLPPADQRNEWVAIQLKDKTLLLVNLLTNKEIRAKSVSDYNFTFGGKWFSCQLDNAVKELIMVNMSTGKIHHFENVISHSFDESQKALILQTEQGGRKGLEWVDPLNGKTTEVWTATGKDRSSIGGYMVDKACRQLAFTVQNATSVVSHNSVWYYKKGMGKAMQKKIEDTDGRMMGMMLSGTPVFTDDGRYIVISMQKPKVVIPKPAKNAIQLDVWNYRDTFLMSAQVAGIYPLVQSWLSDKVYKFSMAVEDTGQMIYLSGENEQLFSTVGDYAVLQKRIVTDRFWEHYTELEFYVVSLKDGKRRPLKRGVILPQFSPDRTWLLCYDSTNGKYLRYDIGSNQYRDLDGGANVYFGGENEFDGNGRQPKSPRGQVGWLTGNRGLLVYDHYDIWQLDVNGIKPPVNLTNGRKDNVRFEITKSEQEEGGSSFYSPHAKLVLTAVNMENKDNGFYALQLDSRSLPEKLCMGPYIVYLGGLTYGQEYWGSYSKGRRPLKAADADVWLLVRQSTTEAPNFFIAQGLKIFNALTNLQPHKDYNWLGAELVNFKQQDGSKCKGILYKPENFDPTKKYPVLIHYYDQFSMCLNQYPVIAYTSSAFTNIPWFVSRGYLVFLPDIYFNKEAQGIGSMNEPKIPYGAAALNAVEGAANWLSSKSYVDSAKMGIAGHSMGGGLTSYILTHSNRFAAAFMGAGVSDWISGALQLNFKDGMSRLGVSYYSGSTGSDIWINNAKYLDNPILHVAKVTSPLLMFHCKADSGVPFEQAVELFVAMRRMSKKVWLLQYDQGVHSTLNQRDDRDLTIRVTQFFDHYLKGAPAPIWMTQGIRASMKGIQTGYEWDTSGRQP
ncbi:dienelactone hydrolase [Pedobacter sp. AK017]|uniref:alpha/beta hydrolase family protein n=1 Tax=Pedobacter sp. AK017 TaxID=2723073 RepID=UPI00161A4DBD|nr:prolyl oligopeptidase family serine peptidase [Pedobacter sp. AK017]MBB5437281.1 dienelactone hydrolase [Pedobacter sp. AK017]